MPPPASVGRVGRGVLLGGGMYGVALLIIGLWPRHVDERIDVVGSRYGRWLMDRGLTYRQTYDLIEGLANIAMYVPFGIIVAWVLTRLRWWGTVASALVVSGAIELVQAIARPDRTASLIDVLHNTLGAAIGAGAVVITRRLAAHSHNRDV